MPYTIKNYSEDYLEQQYELGNSVLSKWPGAGQSSVDNLKQAYSGENFDPEMKFYAFNGEELVGFCTAAPVQNQPEGEEKKAFMEFPIVKEGHENAFEQLFDATINKLSSKGYKAVRARGGDDWTGTTEWVEKYGYKYHSVLFKRATFKPNEIDLSSFPEPGEISQLDFDKHTDQLIDLVKNEYGVNDDQAKAAVDNLVNLKDQTLSHEIILEDTKIIGRLLVYYPNLEDKETVVFTRAIVVGDKADELRDRLMRSAITRLQRNEEITKAQIFLNGNIIDREDLYASLNVEFEAPLSFYEKEI